MKLEIVRYSDSLEISWNEAVTNSINGTFLHTRAFFDHNALNRIDDCSFLYFKKNKVAGVIPGTLYEKDGRIILNSHLRATYGGFVVTNEVGVEEAVEMVEKLVLEAKKLQVNEIIIRNPFRIFHQKICEETDYAMWYHGFSIKSRELETVVQLHQLKEAQSEFDSSTLRSVRKSRQHISVTLSDNFEMYWELLHNNLSRNHGIKPTHSYPDFQLLLQKIGFEKIKLFAGFKSGQMAAGIVVFLANKISLHAQYIASDEALQEFRPLNAVVDEIIQWGAENKFLYLNLGTSNTDAGKGINAGLFRFKEGFGGRNTLRETMHLIL